MKTEALIITTILFSIIMAIAYSPYSDFSSFIDEASNKNEIGSDISSGFGTDNNVNNPSTATLSLWDTSIGYAVGWGKALWKFFKTAIVPFTDVVLENNANPLANLLALIVGTIRTIVYIIGAVKTYQLFKNKGTF